MGNERVLFHFVRSQHFRVVHADGAAGAPTPRGLIHFCLYSERPAVPDSVVQELLPDGTLSDVSDTSGMYGIIREMEVGVMMDEASAAAFHEWLGQQLEQLRARGRVGSLKDR
jgi:hypothetical protein